MFVRRWDGRLDGRKPLYEAKSSAVAETGLKPRADWIFQPRSQKSRDRRIRPKAENRIAMRFPGDGARGTRTPDLLGAIQALSQLSYSPG
jgi:hypothetical protein